MQIRSAMYDYARGNAVLPESLHGLVDRIADQGLNALTLYLEDIAQFVAPELHEGTLDLAALRDLDAHGRRRGVTLIPALNLLGHAEQSLAHPQLHHLGEGDGTFDPRKAETMRVLGDVLRVTAETFSGPWIHLGLDEAWGLGSRHDPAGPWPVDLFCRHANSLAGATAELGRRPMFWADMISRYFPEHAERLDRKLIAVDWYYQPDTSFPRLAALRQAGLDVVVAPAIGLHNGPLPTMDAPARNIGNLLAAGREVGAMGFVLTSWGMFGPIRYREMEMQNHLGGALAAGGWDRPLAEMFEDYWRREVGGSAADVIRMYELCEELADLLPRGLNDTCPHALELRESFFRLYRGSRAGGEQAERIEAELRQLGRRLVEQLGAERAEPFALAADRARTIVELLVGRGEGLLAARRRIPELRRRTGELIATERDARIHAGHVAPRYDRLAAALDALGPKPADLPVPEPDIRELVCSLAGEDAPQILCLTDRRTGKPEDQCTQIAFRAEADALVIAACCTQHGPVRAAEVAIDTILTRDDMLAIQIDPTHEHDESFWTCFNPAGVNFTQRHCRDGQHMDDLTDPRTFPANADAGPTGWSLTIRLPYALFGAEPPKAGEAWGLSIERRNRTTGQTSYWGGDARVGRQDPRALGHLRFT